MKIAICCFNSKYIHSSLAPWYLKAGIEKYCEKSHECEIIESTVNADLSDTTDKICRIKPELVGFCSYIWNIDRVLTAAKTVKEKCPDSLILLGGPEVSYRAKSLLEQYDFLDFIISGEGEEPLSLLADALQGGGEISDIIGLCYRSGEEIIESLPHISAADPPNPYSDEYFAGLQNRICYIESSRGCPFSCAFCLSGRCGGVRYFGMEEVKKNILRLSLSGSKTVKFIDRTFNSNEKRANEIIKFISENYGKAIPNGVCFHFEIAGDILKESTLKLLNSCPKGAVQLEIGMQSFNEETLKKIHRKTDTAKLISNIKKLIAPRNIHIHIDLIAGLTGEDMKSFRRSFNIGYGLRADMLQMGFLKLLYGADMREHPEEYPCSFGYAPPYEVKETPWLGCDEIMSLKKTEDALDRLYNSGRFTETLGYLTDECKIEPFSLFFDFGNFLKAENMPLKKYIEAVYGYFSKFSFVDRKILRDKMVSDRLRSNSSADIPDCLKIPDRRLKLLKKHFSKENLKVGVAILYSENTVIAVEYKNRDAVTGRYESRKYDLDSIMNLC